MVQNFDLFWMAVVYRYNWWFLYSPMCTGHATGRRKCQLCQRFLCSKAWKTIPGGVAKGQQKPMAGLLLAAVVSTGDQGRKHTPRTTKINGWMSHLAKYTSRCDVNQCQATPKDETAPLLQCFGTANRFRSVSNRDIKSTSTAQVTKLKKSATKKIVSSRLKMFWFG